MMRCFVTHWGLFNQKRVNVFEHTVKMASWKTFTFFWLKKISVSVKTFNYFWCVCSLISLIWWSLFQWESSIFVAMYVLSLLFHVVLPTYLLHTTLLENYWIFFYFLRKRGGFQWSTLAWDHLEPSYAYVNFFLPAISLVVGKLQLSEVVFSALVRFSF